VFGLFEFYFALLYIFYIEYALAIWAGFSSAKNMESGSLLFNIPDICDRLPKFLNFSFYFFRG
jgi:hypothetical protein